MKSAALAAATLFLTSTAFGSDWYVDAQSGNDANGGTSTTDAWKTITHALAVVPTPPVGQTEAIHVATGIYDTALGETFPLMLRPGLQLLGDSIARPTLDGALQSVDLIRVEASFGAPGDFDGSTKIRDLVLKRAARGVRVYGFWASVSPSLEDLEVREMSVAGVLVSGQNADLYPELRNLVVELNAIGVQASIGENTFDAGFALTSSLVRNNSVGIELLAAGATLAADGRCDLVDVRVEHNDTGLKLLGGGRGKATGYLTSSIVADNVTNGVFVDSSSSLASAFASIARTTVTRNGVGVALGVLHAGATLSEAIVYGNADDTSFSPGATKSGTYCDIGDAPFGPGNGNFSADPLFVAPASGDFSLSAGSPCIDAGSPTSPLDPDCSRRDVGAIPFAQVNGAIYCTAKVNSCATLPSIGSTGTPSASATSGFVISTTNAKAGKTGLLLYSVQGRAATPFQGGFLCLAGTIKRSPPLVDTTGTGTNCDGVLGLDMNAFAHGLLGGTPLPALTVAGTRVDCQIWGRDTVGNVLLSDGLEYFVCP